MNASHHIATEQQQQNNVSRDKQLRSVELDYALQKRQLGQGLNAKCFALLAGLSYSKARQLFRQPGFPVCGGLVFWDDFVLWRRGLHVVAKQASVESPVSQAGPSSTLHRTRAPQSASRAARILEAANSKEIG